MTDREKKNRTMSICFLTFAVLCEILVTLSYERGILAVQHYAAPLCFAFMGMMMLGGSVKLQADEKIALLYPLWYMASRILLKELYLDNSFYPFCSMILVYGMAFPFARLVNDSKTKTGLLVVAVLFGSVYGALSWVGVYAAVSKHTITLPWLGTELAMNNERRLIMSTHPNVVACIFFSAFVLLMWIALSDHRRWTKPLYLIAMLGIYFAIALTDSRTVMIQLSAAMAFLAMFACQKLPIRGKPVRLVLSIAVAAAVLMGVFLSFDAAAVGLTEMSILRSAKAEAEVFVANRAADFRTLTGRTTIYESVFQLLSDHKDVLLRGLKENEYVAVQNQYDIPVNTHNAWLQTLLMTGIPGLLIALWFTFRAIQLAWISAFCCQTGVRVADRFLLVAPAVMMINGITESYVFTELKPYYNLIFFMLLGYALEIWRKMRTEKRNAPCSLKP